MSHAGEEKVVVVDRRAWFVRLYGWLWGASAADITVCKLFWAYVFAPLALFVLKPLRFIFRRKSTGKALARIEGAAARHPRIGRTVSLVWTLVAGGYLLFGLVVGFINAPVVMGAILGGIALLVLFIAWLARSERRQRRLRFIAAVEKFALLLLAGYRAVKTRTCPRMEVR